MLQLPGLLLWPELHCTACAASFEKFQGYIPADAMLPLRVSVDRKERKDMSTRRA